MFSSELFLNTGHKVNTLYGFKYINEINIAQEVRNCATKKELPVIGQLFSIYLLLNN